MIEHHLTIEEVQGQNAFFEECFKYLGNKDYELIYKNQFDSYAFFKVKSSRYDIKEYLFIFHPNYHNYYETGAMIIRNTTNNRLDVSTEEFSQIKDMEWTNIGDYCVRSLTLGFKED